MLAIIKCHLYPHKAFISICFSHILAISPYTQCPDQGIVDTWGISILGHTLRYTPPPPVISDSV